jgi:hypothetical protein
MQEDRLPVLHIMPMQELYNNVHLLEPPSVFAPWLNTSQCQKPCYRFVCVVIIHYYSAVQRRYDMRHEILTQRALLCIDVMAKGLC